MRSHRFLFRRSISIFQRRPKTGIRGVIISTREYASQRLFNINNNLIARRKKVSFREAR
jgi:hypothetical protein